MEFGTITKWPTTNDRYAEYTYFIAEPRYSGRTSGRTRDAGGLARICIYMYTYARIRTHIHAHQGANRASTKRGKRAVSCRASSRASESCGAPIRSLRPLRHAAIRKPASPAPTTHSDSHRDVISETFFELHSEISACDLSIQNHVSLAKSHRFSASIKRRRNVDVKTDTNLDQPGIDPTRPFSNYYVALYCFIAFYKKIKCGIDCVLQRGSLYVD